MKCHAKHCRSIANTIDTLWIMNARPMRFDLSLRVRRSLARLFGLCLATSTCAGLMAADFDPPSTGHFELGTTPATVFRADGIRPTFAAAPAIQPASTLQSSGFTLNQSVVGKALDNVSTTATGSLLTMINSLSAETAADQRTSLTMLSSQLYSNTQTIGLQVGDQFQQRLITRLVSNGPFLTGSSEARTLADVGSATAIRGQSPAMSQAGWVQAYGVGTSLSNDGNSPDLYYSQAGFLSGLDLAADETGVLGVTGGNSYVDFSTFGAGGQMVASQVGLYILKQNDSAYMIGLANYGYNSFDTSRAILVGGANLNTRGEFGSHQFGTYLESGLRFHADWLHIQPLVGLQYLNVSQQGFGESGGAAALNVSGSQADSLRTSLGARLVVDQLKGPWGAIWTPYWHCRWISDLVDNDRTVAASFVGAPIGSVFVAHGNHLGNNHAIIGKGFNVQLDDDLSLFVNYDGMFGGGIDVVTASGGLVFNW